ncbi:MAG: hypothetical protein P8X51_04890 [Maritimibacter sp.]
MKTLEIETDLMVTGTRSVLDHRDDRVIQRSPGEPDFWFGNRTIFREAPEEIEAAIAIAQADFPDQRFSVISWDVPDLDPSPYKPALEAAGYEIEQGITLAGQQVIRPGLPEGIRFAEIERDEDWDAVITLQTESLIAEGRLGLASLMARFWWRIWGWSGQNGWCGFNRWRPAKAIAVVVCVQRFWARSAPSLRAGFRAHSR